ncbi:multicopper oxidase family protein [Roseofilum casamattae]|uniref:Multicopper oxidase family protein n=1 Tax=Roseofilum casamattae BLCC-M143 TaxID=3022442 RepID=A0ABT7BR47_9CYAN|nr:multicopper oxidase family protein [Roseofilum casamattae]MDJ1181665.1 multicopper oxidase family protein [Roseofilum casamattae BLCC-M143]
MGFNRRQLLVIGMASLGTTWASHRVFRPRMFSSEKNESSAPVYRSQDGRLEVALTASDRRIRLGNKSARLMTYNQQLPGPRLEVKPGDRVRIHFTNYLNEATNLHYHGLHIPISGNGDNVFLQIRENETFTYDFQIPSNHRAGLFWYHPHHHGLVAKQLFAGLAGLFVVRGELDRIPEIKDADEQFLVLQDFGLDEKGNRLDDRDLSIMTGREGNAIAVNGLQNPTLTIPAGKLLRLRILNASPSRFYRLALEEHSFHLIATDGGALSKPIACEEILLSPGERADVLVQGNREPGQYRLLNLPYERIRMGMMGSGDRNSSSVLATVSYATSSHPLLPQQLIPIEPLPEPKFTRQFILNHGMSSSRGMSFLINRQSYDPERIDTAVKLDTVEDWELQNTGIMDHPFHVHGNSFQILSRNGISEPYLSWKDVVLVKPGETVKIRLKFRDFTGKAVYHCHVLDHEDLGMMGNLQIGA